MDLIKQVIKSGYIDKIITGKTKELAHYYVLCDIQKWLREEHHIDIIVKPWSGSSVNTKTYAADVCVFGTPKYLKLQRIDVYEHALENGLQEALKLI